MNDIYGSLSNDPCMQSPPTWRVAVTVNPYRVLLFLRQEFIPDVEVHADEHEKDTEEGEQCREVFEYARRRVSYTVPARVAKTTGYTIQLNVRMYTR